MIPCQSCGHQNPMQTRYCRACGTKLEVKAAQVFESVREDASIQASNVWFERGKSLIVIGAFFLTCALVLRYALVPPMPKADVPPVDVGGWLPTELPKVEAK